MIERRGFLGLMAGAAAAPFLPPLPTPSPARSLELMDLLDWACEQLAEISRSAEVSGVSIYRVGFDSAREVLYREEIAASRFYLQDYAQPDTS